jgi:uncharacterized membrane protein
MSLAIILIVATFLSVAFHFVGVYANAKKTVWIMLVLMWAAAINLSMSEIKPKGYEDIKSMQGKYEEVDRLIENAKPEISIYEMLGIKKSFSEREPKE